MEIHMPLPDVIRAYYFTHMSELPAEKQFHFASRMSSWDQDPQALALLQTLRSMFVTDSIGDDLSLLINKPPVAKINAAERRAPYFQKYPQLRGCMLALFRVRHLLFHFDIDARDDLLRSISLEQLMSLGHDLKEDTEALKVLSTYAINYIFLVESILFPSPDTSLVPFLNDVVKLHDQYDDTPEDSLLMIYLFTHCIIGASNFYQTSVSLEEYPVYRTMLERIESRIDTHYPAINLDNKFEFLVCCRITGFSSHLEQAIQSEAEQSMSPEGSFLVDTINTAKQGNKTSSADSEHRNVLYIMSQSTFRPKYSISTAKARLSSPQ